MTIGGAIAELQNLINADDVPFYYKGGIQKVIETIQMEMVAEQTEPTTEDCSMVTSVTTDTSCEVLDGWQTKDKSKRKTTDCPWK